MDISTKTVLRIAEEHLSPEQITQSIVYWDREIRRQGEEVHAGPLTFAMPFDGMLVFVDLAPRFNIAPSQPVLAVPNDERLTADFFLWGLIPMWAKDPTIGSRLINARGETVAEKPSFRGSFKHKRCLILADGFYEWKASPVKKLLLVCCAATAHSACR